MPSIDVSLRILRQKGGRGGEGGEVERRGRWRGGGEREEGGKEKRENKMPQVTGNRCICTYLKQTSPVSLMFGCQSRVLHTT